MKGITVRAGIGGSARLEEVPEPDPAEGAVLVQTIAVGVCGTDRDILNGEYGEAPPGRDRLVIGDESLGRGARRQWSHAGRPGGRHRPPAGPRAL